MSCYIYWICQQQHVVAGLDRSLFSGIVRANPTTPLPSPFHIYSCVSFPLPLHLPLPLEQYLGTYLLSYVKAMEAEALKVASVERLTSLEASLAASEAASAASTAAASAKKKQLQAESDSLELSLSETAVPPSGIDAVLSLLQVRTGATGAYFGRRETDSQGSSQIQYTNSTQEFMVGAVLKGGAEGEEESFEGVTWPLFASSEVEETTVDAEGEETTVTRTVFPEDVVVENVVRNGGVKCFGLPKLGAYLAVPVRFNSCLWEGGVEDAEPAPEVEAVEGGEGEEASEEAEAEAEAKAKEVAAPPPREFDKFQPVYRQMECVIGLDTVGQGVGRLLDPESKDLAREWGGKLAGAKAKAELQAWKETVEKLQEWGQGEVDQSTAKEQGAAKLAEQVAQLSEAVAGAGAGAGAAEGEEAANATAMSEDVKALRESELRTASALELLGGTKAQLLAVGGFAIPPRNESTKVLGAAMALIGTSEGDYVDVKTGKIDWGKLRMLVGEDFYAKVEALDVASVGDDEKLLEKVRGMVEGSDEAGVPFSHVVVTSFTVGNLLGWVNAACAGAEANKAFKVKEAEAAAEAAAAAAEAAAPAE